MAIKEIEMATRRVAGWSKRVLLALSSVFFAGLTQAATPYQTPIQFDRPGWAQTSLWDVNDGGAIIGNSFSSDFLLSVSWVFQNGHFEDIAPPGHFGTTATGVSNGGLIVGSYWNASNVQLGFLYENGVYQDFSVPGATDVLIRDVSSNGRYFSGTWSDGAGNYGFTFDRQLGTRTDVPLSGSLQIQQGVNSLGQAVGTDYSIAPGVSYVFDLLAMSVTHYPGDSQAARPRFRDINDLGQIAGFSLDSAIVGVPGDWTLIAAPAGMSGMLGYGLNNAGMLVGHMVDDAGLTHGFYALPVPEPGSWALLGLGLLTLAARRRSA